MGDGVTAANVKQSVDTVQRRRSRFRSLMLSDLTPIWIAGILIRLLLMPFTFHADLYSIYSRSYLQVSSGHWFSFSSQIMIQWIHNVWFAIVQPLLPNSHGIWSPTAVHIGVGVQPDDYARFLAYPHLARALFMLKLPYFAADLATGYVLTHLVEPCWRRRVLALWLLNPVVIFVSAVFGRHDSLAVLAVMLSTLLALRGRRYSGMLLLGVGAAARFFPAFLAPFYVISFRRSRRELGLLLGGLIGFWVVIELSLILVTGTSPTLTLLNRYPHVEYLFDMGLAHGVGGQLFIFPFAYTLLLLWFIDRGKREPESYVPIAAAVMLMLFALTHFHPQYSIWIVPFLVLTMYRDPKLIAYHTVQIVLLVFFSLQFGTGATWGLFRPLAGASLDRLPDPMNIVGAFIPVDIFLGVVRSLFTAVSLWMAFVILRQQQKEPSDVRAEVMADALD
jgi:hypothetical protein